MDIDNRLEDLIKTLNIINYQLADLKEIKEKLEREVIELTGRASFVRDETGKYIMMNIAHDGQKLHKVGPYKFEVKTTYNISIDKDEYEAVKRYLRPEFNPVIEKIAYSVNNKALGDLNTYGSESDKGLVYQFIKKSPAKPYVNIKADV